MNWKQQQEGKSRPDIKNISQNFPGDREKFRQNFPYVMKSYLI